MGEGSEVDWGGGTVGARSVAGGAGMAPPAKPEEGERGAPGGEGRSGDPGDPAPDAPAPRSLFGSGALGHSVGVDPAITAPGG